MSDEGITPPPDDAKDLMIGGCHVRLVFRRMDEAHWTVRATVECGLEDNAAEQSVVTGGLDSREAAEREAIEQVTALLGHHTDRSHSRVRNWS